MSKSHQAWKGEAFLIGSKAAHFLFAPHTLTQKKIDFSWLFHYYWSDKWNNLVAFVMPRKIQTAFWGDMTANNRWGDLFHEARCFFLLLSPPGASPSLLHRWGCQLSSCWLICLAVSGPAGPNGATWLAWLYSNLRPDMIWAGCCLCRFWLTSRNSLLPPTAAYTQTAFRGRAS